MAHSIQTVLTRQELFDDLDLIVVMQLMLREFERNKRTFSGIEQVVLGWRQELTTSGPGTIDLRLDQALDHEEGIGEMARLIDVAQQGLSRFGDVIPAQILNTEYETPSVLFYDFATVRVVETLNKIRRLIGVTT